MEKKRQMMRKLLSALFISKKLKYNFIERSD